MYLDISCPDGWYHRAGYRSGRRRWDCCRFVPWIGAWSACPAVIHHFMGVRLVFFPNYPPARNGFKNKNSLSPIGIEWSPNHSLRTLENFRPKPPRARLIKSGASGSRSRRERRVKRDRAPMEAAWFHKAPELFHGLGVVAAKISFTRWDFRPCRVRVHERRLLNVITGDSTVVCDSW